MKGLRRFRPEALAVSRIGRFWLDVWKCWRLTLDWTVQVYIALPALFVFANLYRDAWEHPPGWFDLMTAQTVAVLLGILMLRARLRTFADPGDGLIVRRSGRWMAVMLAVGCVYTYAARLLLAAFAVLLLIPVFSLRLGWTSSDDIALAVGASLLGFVWALARDAVLRHGSGRKATAALWLVRSALMAAWTAAVPHAIHGAVGRLLCAAVLAAAAALLVWRRARARGTFLQELADESDAYSGSVRLLLRYSAGLPKRPSSRKPRMLLTGRRLFRLRDRDSRIAELWVKSSLRDSENRNVLIVLALATSLALLLVPPGLGLVLWPMLGALGLFWMHGQWRQWEEERYVAMLPWRPEALRSAEERGRWAVFAPLFLGWGLALGVKFGMTYGAFGWLGVAGLPAAGWPLGRILNGRMTAFLAARERSRVLRRRGDEERRTAGETNERPQEAAGTPGS